MSTIHKETKEFAPESKTTSAESLTSLMDSIDSDLNLSNYLTAIPKVYPAYEFFKHIDPLDPMNTNAAESIRIYNDTLEKESILKGQHRWRLFIDGCRQKETNPLIFDRNEPGYHNQMYKAFLLMEKTLTAPLSIDLIMALHDFAVKGVGGQIRSASGFDDNPRETSCGLRSSNATPKGLTQLFQEFSSFTRPLVDCHFLRECTLEETLKVFIEAPSYACVQRYGMLLDEKQLREKLQEFIDEYHHSIAIAQNDPELILKAIATFVHKGNVLHPFKDGNTRTFVFLIANKLLLQNNFSPAIFENPNKFDGYSTEELFIVMKQALEKAKSYGFTAVSPKLTAELPSENVRIGAFITEGHQTMHSLFSNPKLCSKIADYLGPDELKVTPKI
jgi:hypothetical protein